MPKEKKRVMSLRLDEGAHRRLRAYAASAGLTDSEAARRLIASGLAADGLGLYSTELGAYLRSVVEPLIEGFDQALDRRNAEQEDRIARVVHRAARGSIVAAIAAIEVERGVFEGLGDISASEIYQAYDEQARLMQAGMTLDEARERAGRGGAR
ncbi:hypothetical protein DXC81_08215 [Collinsella tanakaei]|uniref:Uncharacterized protein n=2 Tax=Collinsella tanakaei TaxID=626935 RepID=A0A3E4QR53_9ACTN|nr:hypothetical protein DXC81_08215 [Collinsella tanakaei]